MQAIQLVKLSPFAIMALAACGSRQEVVEKPKVTVNVDQNAFSKGAGKAPPSSAPPTATGVAYSPGIKLDEISWLSFMEVVSPAPGKNSTNAVTFETWATDEDTYGTVPPVWPQGVSAERDSHRFQVSALGLHAPSGLQVPVDSQGVPTPCAPPANAAAGNFPSPAGATPPTNCLAEEVRRNKPAFNYIVDNDLYSVAGFRKSNKPIDLPQSSDLKKAAIEVKVDWIPVDTVVPWLSANGVPDVNAAFVRQNYFITQQPDGTAYALVSMHISVKDRPSWLWATFEHQLNPGRCDTMGCFDEFGMPPPLTNIPPAVEENMQYAACSTKSSALNALFELSGLAGLWKNYCLKSTQIDFVSTQIQTKGEPVLAGDSVVERILAGVPIARSSCISCHANATFGSKGCISPNNVGISPNDQPIGAYKPIIGEKQNDFVWGFINMPGAICP